MNIRVQTLILILLLLFSLTINLKIPQLAKNEGTSVVYVQSTTTPKQVYYPQNTAYGRASLLTVQTEIRKAPMRNWDIVDPKITAESVLVQSLDENFPFFYLNTYKSWPAASLTKLLTAVVVVEKIGVNKKIPIYQTAIDIEGEAGGLRSGEVFTARDLLKIMLLTSSNDAAAAFEEYLGKDTFVGLMNEKAKEIGMQQSVFYDATGLSDLDLTTASDMLLLTKYILEKEPEIMGWTRLESQLIQPINDVTSRTILNINSLVKEAGFLGGKTGTSENAKENIVVILSLKNNRIVFILLGSQDRTAEIKLIADWVSRAYTF